MPNLLSTRSARLAASAAVILAAGFGGWQSLTAQSISGHDSNAPVNYAADRIELQGKQDRVVLSGNVDVTQAGLRVRAAQTVVDFTNAGSLKIQRITATGGVVVTRGDETARGDVAVYDFNRRIITMAGNAALRRGNDTMQANRFVIDLNSGVSSAEGGRVSGTFSAPKNN
jgi:lipopolysaccharide export system protein LptA